MCGAYGLSIKNAKDVYDRLEIVNTLENLQPRWNLRPGQMNPVITAHSPNQISYMFWGLIPHWARESKVKFSSFNARAETVATSAVYREPFRHKRCVIPATGFFEPDKVNFPKPPHPWHFFRLKETELFAFAGLYDVWTDKQTGKDLYSYTLITTEPNALVGKFHGRMPVILNKEDEAARLNPDTTEAKDLLPLLKPFPADRMQEWHVGDAAKNPRNVCMFILPHVHASIRLNRSGFLLSSEPGFDC
jgi:putative SOS response-associated peptidase YedK